MNDLKKEDVKQLKRNVTVFACLLCACCGNGVYLKGAFNALLWLKRWFSKIAPHICFYPSRVNRNN